MAAILNLKLEGKPVLRGQEHCWSIIRDMTATDRDRLILAADVHGYTNGTDLSTVSGFLRKLAAAGYLAEVADGDRTGYRVLRRATRPPQLSADGEVVPSGQQQMWVAMRSLSTFSAHELAVVASTEERPVTLQTAKSYVKHLNAAGYLKIETPAAPPHRGAQYRLIPRQDSGPLAPRILRAKIVYDPNRNKIMGPVTAEEVA
ncbi:MAG: hypothetical protein JNM13_15565 [Hyphomicrobiaceae bacterium]|nr:hypothetical protein [Hyphomicrobiaceae bacterium]